MKSQGISGFTLIEVLLAAALLGIGMVVLMFGLSQCLSAIRVSARLQEVQWVLGLGELAYPVQDRWGTAMTDPELDLAVPADGSLAEGYQFERLVDPDEDEDGLYVVRTRVHWGAGEGAFEEVVRYVWFPE